MSKIIIAATGFAGSGKDTFGDHLVQQYGFKKASFAQPLKEACRLIYNFTDEQLYGSLKEEPDKRYLFGGDCMLCGATMIPCDALIDAEQAPALQCLGCEWSYEHKYVTPRLAMQTLGTEWGRRLCLDTWTAPLFDRIHQSSHDRWVICDARFHAEMRTIRDSGGYLVRMLRGGARFAHQSEAEMAEMGAGDFDVSLNNTGTLPHFYKLIDEYLTTLPEIRGTSAY